MPPLLVFAIALSALSSELSAAFTRSPASILRPHRQTSPSFSFGTGSLSRIHREHNNGADGRRRAMKYPTKRHQTKEASSANDSSGSTSSWGIPPYLAVLTEPDACSSVERVEETMRAIEEATADGGVNLVVLRVAGDGDESALLKWALLKNLAEMKRRRRFLLVVNDDVEIVLRALSQNMAVDGVHVKEYKSHLIPSIRSELEHAATCSFDKGNGIGGKELIVGSSCHSVESATRSYQLSPRGPDYLFVGTCYLTQSHPEKDSSDQLEGPALPGRVRRELHRMHDGGEGGASINADANIISTEASSPPPPVVLAIGGIEERNCDEPVAKFGADGVATIRTVMQSSDPRRVVRHMKRIMRA